MKIILQFLITGIAIAFASYLVPWVYVDGLRTAIVVGVMLAIVNATVGFLLRIITLPFNILTLGLVGFLIGVLMILLVDRRVDGFSISGFWSWLRFAVIFWLINMVFSKLKD